MRRFFSYSFFFSKLLFLLICRNAPILVMSLLLVKSADKRQKVKILLARRIMKILPKLGPLFIKLGQILSTRSDVLGEDVAGELFYLQDSAPPFSAKLVKKIFIKDFGCSPEKIFSFFDYAPKAAASVAQVHYAITQDEKKIAVKILRPNIKKIFKTNLECLRVLHSIANYFLFDSSNSKIDEILSTVEKTVEIELNLLLEGAAATKMKINAKQDKGLYIPEIYWSYSTKNILAIEWIDGVLLKDKEGLNALGIDCKDLSKRLAIIFFNQSCRDGFFHADIHPGNIIIKKSGDIALVDFGIVCHLDYELKNFITEALYMFITKNYKGVSDLHFDMGLVNKKFSRNKFELACTSIGESILNKSVSELSIAKLLRNLIEVNREFEVKIKPELFLLHKTILTVEGTGYYLYPKINMWKLITPWMVNWRRKSMRKIEKARKFIYNQKKVIENFESAIDFLARKDNHKFKTQEVKKSKIRKVALAFLICSAVVFYAKDFF